MLAPPLLVVLDTNIWLDLLVFRDPGVDWLTAALLDGHVDAVIDAFGVAEFERVLGYRLGRFALAPEQRLQKMDACRALACEFSAIAEAPGAVLPRCRDRHDQPFLELAHACGARYLITKDRDLLMLARRLGPQAGFAIITPKDARQVLASGS